LKEELKNLFFDFPEVDFESIDFGKPSKKSNPTFNNLSRFFYSKNKEKKK